MIRSSLSLGAVQILQPNRGFESEVLSYIKTYFMWTLLAAVALLLVAAMRARTAAAAPRMHFHFW